MPKVVGTVTSDGNTTATQYTGTATNNSQTFYFDDTQDSMIFTTDGRSDLTLKVDGRSYIVKPNIPVEIYEDFSSFNVTRKDKGSQSFTLTSYVFADDNDSIVFASVEDALTSTNSKNALSANQGRVLKGLIDTNTTNIDTNTTNIGNKLDKSSVEDVLTSSSPTNALSANQGRVLNAQLKDIAPLKSFGVKGDGVTDDTVALQNVIDSFGGGNNGGHLVVPTGNYLLSGITFPSYFTLIGEGEVIFKHKANSTTPLLSLKSDAVQNVTVDGITLDGNKSAWTGAAQNLIHFFNNDVNSRNASKWNTGLGSHKLENLFLRNSKGDGLYIEGTGGNFIKDIQAYDNSGNGLQIVSPDTWVVNCDSALSGLRGFYIKNSSIRLSNCKAWYSGTVDPTKGLGFEVLGNRAQMDNCEAQENFADGFYIHDVNSCTFSEITADANGYNYYTNTINSNAAGFTFVNATNCRLSGVATNFHGSANPRQTVALKLDANSKGNRIDLTVTNQVQEVAVDSKYNTDNDVIIRNDNASILNLVNKKEQRYIGQSISVNTGDWVRIAKIGAIAPMVAFRLYLSIYKNTFGCQNLTLDINIPMNFPASATCNIVESQQGVLIDQIRLNEDSGSLYLEVRSSVTDASVLLTYSIDTGTYLNGAHRPLLVSPTVVTTGTSKKVFSGLVWGATASRPTGLNAADTGLKWYDTTLGKPIFWSGSVWKDAAGTVV